MEKARKIENLAITVYGVLIVLYGLFDILLQLLPDTRVDSLQPAADWINYFFIYTCIILYLTPINFIVGYGLIRHRYWARYGIVAVMMTLPIHVISQMVWWGTQSIEITETAIQFLVITLTLTYFSGTKVRSLFGMEYKFRVKSWHGLLVCFIVIFASVQLITALAFKFWAVAEHKEPLFVGKPESVYLNRPDEAKFSETYKQVELLDMRLLIPKEFAVWSVQPPEDNDDWGISLFDTARSQGLIMIGNQYPFDQIHELDGLEEATRITSKYGLEKFILTNNWNPALVTIRAIVRPIGEQLYIKEIHINGMKGFLKTWDAGKRMLSEFTLYGENEIRFASGTISYNEEAFGEEDIYAIVSSIEFLNPEKTTAEDYYEKGIEYYSNGQFIDAQFEFASAYYKSPENPEYIYIFAKSLSKDGAKAFKYIKGLLEKVLELNPEHEEAKQLLIEIELELKEDKS